jgi:CBS domain-containing protein
MKVHEIMTAHARCVGPDDTLVEVAGLMRELDVGALPICDNDRLAGMVTDRDIVLRGTADGKDPNTTTVRDVMSQGIIYVFADQDVEEAARIMEEKQIRRLPVLSREKRLVGIVSLGDLATSSSPMFSGQALRDVSQSSHPTGRQRRLTERSRGMEAMPSVPGATRGPRGAQKRGAGARSRRREEPEAKTSRSARGGTRGRAQSTRSEKKSSRGRAPSRGARSRRTSSRSAR